MTERDLLEYAHLEHEIDKLREKYREEEQKMCRPRSPSLSGMPHGSSGASDDALMEILDRRRRIKERIERLNEDRIVAERRLERAYSALETDLEREVFNALYREGETILEAISLLHYSKTHIYRQRERILSTIKDIPA